MTSKGQEICKEPTRFGDNDGQSQKKSLSNLQYHDNFKMSDKNPVAFSDCVDMMHSDMRRIESHANYDYTRSDVLKPNERIPYADLKRLYAKVEDRKINGEQKSHPEEQPLDFSKKTNSSNRRNECLQKIDKLSLNTTTYHRSQENSENASDSVDDSCDDETAHAHFAINSRPNSSRVHGGILGTNGIFEKVDEQIQKFQTKTFPQTTVKNEFKRNNLRVTNSSESEEESRYEQIAIRKRNAEGGRNHFQPKSPSAENLSVERRMSLHSQHSIPHETNCHSEIGSNGSVEKSDRFQIQNILGHSNNSALPEKHSQTHRPITSPKPTSSNFDKDNTPSTSSSPSHYMNLMNQVFSQGANNIPQESGGMFPSYIPAVFPPSQFANLVNRNSPDVPGYSRLCAYPPGGMLQPPFNPMYAHPYHPALQSSQNQQKHKNQRPFKSIDPSILLSHLPISQSAAALGLGSSPLPVPCNSSKINSPDCSAPAGMNSSPQSPDSPCIANNSGNSNEALLQDGSGETGRKKIRRIPPEERDAKYIEKRAKNNIAAKKSRDERRKKEDLLALSCSELVTVKVKLGTENEMLRDRLRRKEMRLDMITANLISFRERCEGRTKEAFDDLFNFFLSQE